MLLLFAEEAVKSEQPPGGPFGNPFFFMVMIGIFMFAMIWLPARRQRKEQAAMLASIRPGSKVVTASGIIGTIIRLKEGEDEMVIRSEDAKIKITKTSIVRVLGVEEETK